MSVGAVEYVIIGFPGSEFTGGIVPALADLRRRRSWASDASAVTADNQGNDKRGQGPCLRRSARARDNGDATMTPE